MTRPVRVLHVSDLHRGCGGDSRWTTTRARLLDDLSVTREENGPPDFIAFTGDLAYSGKKREYKLVDRTIAEIQERVGPDVPILAVPGNHDLGRPSSADVPAGLEDYFGAKGRDVRRALGDGRPRGPWSKAIRKYFSEYVKWFDRTVEPTWRQRGWAIQRGPVPGDFRLVANVDGLRIGFVGVNSAFLHYGDVKEGALAVETGQLGPDPDSWLAETDLALLLMHHPPAWLHGDTRFLADIYHHTRFVACLHGHMHEATSETQTRRGQTHRFFQAPSLFGLESYGTKGERRVMGYTWLTIEANTTSARLKMTPRTRLLERVGAIDDVREAGDAAYPHDDVPMRNRRTRPAYVSEGQLLLGFAHDVLADADAIFESTRYSEARTKYQSVAARLSQAEVLTVPEKQLRATAQFRAAACLFNTRQHDDAVSEFRALDVAMLDERARGFLARAYAQLGDVETARTLAPASDARLQSLLAIAAGEEVDDRALDPYARSVLAMRLAGQGAVGRAVTMALVALDERQTDDEGTLANAIESLLLAAEIGLLGETPVPLPPGASHRIAALAREYVEPDHPMLVKIVDPVQRARWRARLAVLGHDRETVEEQRAVIAAAGADDRTLSSALHLLGPDETGSEWQKRLNSALASSRPSRPDLVVALAEEFPNALMIRGAAAEACLGAADVAGAMVHADAAFQLWPGFSQRLILARALLAARDYSAVEALLAQDTPRAETLGVLAASMMAQPSRAGDAVACWRDFLAKRPADFNAQLELGWALYLAGEARDARKQLAKVVSALEKMADAPLETLERAARLAAATTHESQGEDASAIGRMLRGRGGERAQRLYARIWPLAKSEGLPAPNYESMADSGVLRRVDRGEASRLLGDAANLASALLELYASGQLPLEAYAQLTGAEHAMLVEQAVCGERALVTPPRFLECDITTVESMASRSVLVGHLELLLLDQFDLLDLMDKALGPEGRFVLFQDVLFRVQREHAMILGRLDQTERDLVARTLHSLGLRGEAFSPPVPAEADAEWASRNGFVLISDSGEASSGGARQRLSALVAASVRAGLLPRSMSLVPAEGVPALEGVAAVDYGACLELERSGVLAPLVEAGAARPTPLACATLQLRLRGFQLVSDAAKRALRLHERLAQLVRAGRVTVAERPYVDLPPLMDGAPAQFRDAIVAALGWREYLHLHAETIFVCGDLLAGGILDGATPLVLMRAVHWRANPQLLDVLRASRQATARRVVGVGAMVGLLCPPHRRSAASQACIALGFADVWSARDLVAHALDWQSLDGPTTSRLLDGVERSARSPNIEHATIGPTAVTALYALAICEAWRGEDRDAAQRLTRLLLTRASALPTGLGQPALELVFLFMLGDVFANPILSTVPLDQSRARLDADSPYGQMWAEVRDWIAGRDATARTAFRRAFQESAVRLLGTDGLGRGVVHVGPAVIAASVVDGFQATELLPPGSAIESLAIATSCWASRPLDSLQVEMRAGDNTRVLSLGEVLDLVAAEVAAGRGELDDGGDTWSAALPGFAKSPTRVPVDAVLPRFDAAALRKYAAIVAPLRLSQDGRSATLLNKLADGSAGRGDLERYIAHATCSPARVVGVDPSMLLVWGAPETYPSSVAELCEMLSEDPASDAPIGVEALFKRCAGPWAGESAIVRQATRIPGSIGDIYFQLRLEAFLGAAGKEIGPVLTAINRAEQALLSPDDLVIGDLLDAVRHVVLHSSMNSAAVEESRAIITSLLRALKAGPREGSLASLEHRLLWGCVNSVERLCWPGGEVPSARMVWIAWRLFQWLLTAVATGSGKGDVRLLGGFANLSTSPRRAAGPEVLDPVRFGPTGFDYRLASVLLALASLRPGAVAAVLGVDAIEVLEDLSRRDTTPVERELLDLPPSVLGWDGPRSISALAGRLLQALKSALPEG